jgi:dihydrofolate reductase
MNMRKRIVWEFVSMDGVMESPERWVMPFQSQDVAEFVAAQNLASDTLLLGKTTYEAFATFWPSQTHNEFGFADKLNRMPKFVVSSTLNKAEWSNSVIINKNVVEEINKLKQQPGGNVGITGSATLVQSLMQADLVDEYRLLVHPIVLGDGKRLFRDGIASKTLKLVDTRPFSSGVVALSYQIEQDKASAK